MKFEPALITQLVGAGLAMVAAFGLPVTGDQRTAILEFTAIVVDDSGSRGALEAIFAARHVGEFAGIPPTGREVRVPYSVHYELTDGHISALRVYGLVQGLLAALTS